MGFFKNIGKSIKKAVTKVGSVVKTGLKQVSFKNVVKLASKFDPTGIVGGLQASHEAKKEEKAFLEEQAKAQAEYDKQIALENEAAAETQRQLMEQAKANAEYQRMIVASNTQAIGGKIGVVGASIAGQITQQAMRTAMDGIDANLQTGLAQAGANLANQSLNEWLKIHWWKVLLAIIAIGFGLRFLLGGNRR